MATMCGSIYNVYEFPGLIGIEILTRIRDNLTKDEIEEYISKTLNIRPTLDLTTIIPSAGTAKIVKATWWLKLKQNEDGWIPDQQWKTFNCRSTKILTSPLHRLKPISRRTIVIAEGFHEWQPIYMGERTFSQLSKKEQQTPPKVIRKQCYLLRPKSGLCRLAALSKKWQDNKYSTGIITLPSHQGFRDIHRKSFPLVLGTEEIEDWLNPEISTASFDLLFQTNDFRETWIATPVMGPEDNRSVGEDIEFRANPN